MRLFALRKKYEANIDIAKANLDVLLHSAVGIGEHSDLTAEMDKWIGEIASNQDKIDAIDELNETKDTPPEQGDLFRETSRW
jgi:DNA-binding transcriptional regulator GbsR (MarR family)